MKYQDKLDPQGLARYAAWLNARARGAGAASRLDAARLRNRILESAGRCEWCDVNLLGMPFELDHIVSLKRGGSNEPGNLGVACAACNRRKAQKPPAQFAAEVYSESGKKTKLVALLLETCGVAASRQIALFEQRPEPADKNSIDVEDDLSPVSQYNWTN